MTLSVGSKIGGFEILALLGAGGMGVVYRARDLRLDRIVAIKSLPPAFAGDPERLARFEREARLLAALAHPHIAGIHGLVDVEGSPHLVLEFVDGETLEHRLARGPLTVRETLEVGAQIASAIDAAHEQGIVHRDLKPANVMLTQSRGVKVLDFGLARDGRADTGSSGDLSMSPTVTRASTDAGVVLGTAPYMSPEQARGLTVDRRTDVWAFGCVLFECLTTRRVFAGDTPSDVIARILEREPDWDALPAGMPPRLREVIRRCLTKAPAERPRDIGDLGRELGSIAAELSSPGGPRAAAGRPSLAVLYFENLGGGAESDYFCSGITEDILTDLSKIKGLRVASRNAVARFRASPADPQVVAAELGVGAVLEGSVRRAGDRVRITAQLVNAADGFHLWAERYDRTLQDVFAVQEEIASSIADALRITLTPAESKNLVQHRPNDVQAYDLYLRGREKYGHYTPETMREALGLFEQAIALDPDYALAWAGVADCHGQFVQLECADDVAETLRGGLAAARRAISLDPRLPEAYKAEALALKMAGDRPAEREALRKALEVNPRFIPALINLHISLFVDGDVAGGERLLRRALDVDPHHGFATFWLAFVLGYTNRHEEALALTRRLRDMWPTSVYAGIARTITAWLLLSRGELAPVEAMLADARAEDARSIDLWAIEAAIAARTGREDEARRRITELEAAPTLRSGHMALAVGAAVRVGELPIARRLLARPIVKDMANTMARLDPEMHGLLDQPPFAPRRLDGTLVWPLEAPMIDARRFALFREVRVEPGALPASGSGASGAF